MQSLAQKKARENFKKAIEYRKKTGCSLKQAFAHVSGKKTIVKKKATPKKVGAVKSGYAKFYNESESILIPSKYFKNIRSFASSGIPKNSIKSGKEIYVSKNTLERIKNIQNKKVGVVKKKAAKKPSEKNILSKIHKVKKDVDNLDEAQHKHMSIGAFNKNIFIKYETLSKEIDQREVVLNSVIKRKKSLVQRNGLNWYNKWIKDVKEYIKELKKHKSELKKFI